jgi:hypothetical protein
MKLGIMQPYFLPYIGYFQLMNAVDEFIVYDDVEYTKKGWINRNRILVHGNGAYITLPLKKASDFLDVKDRFLADTWPTDRVKLLQRVTEAYRKAPQFAQAFPLFERCVSNDESNLFAFILSSLQEVKTYLGIATPVVVSSSMGLDRTLRAQDRVLATCQKENADHYINPIGGVGLYSRNDFAARGIELQFIQSTPVTYPQFDHAFVPWLSILDVMMFNSRSEVKRLLAESYTLS